MDITQSFLLSPLHYIFNPRSVAVIGATERVGVAKTLLFNLIRSPFGGVVYPVNPKRGAVHGIKAYPSISAIPEPVDLAIIVTPAKTVPAIVKECSEAGAKSAIILSAGFAEMGEPGLELERQIVDNKGNMRIIGPNCLGIINPILGLNATFAASNAKKGRVAFLSQSGALCTSILDYSLRENIGFSAFVSTGSMLDVDYGDLIDHFGSDPNTDAIVFYAESIGNPKKFYSAARQVALTKPIIVIKAGRTAEGSAAAASHTGSLTGSDDILTAMFERCGVLRVDKIAELFYMAEVLSKQPRPKGNRLTIVTNAGGPGVLSTDSLISGDGQLTELSTETINELNSFLPNAWSHGNPVDVLGDSDESRYQKTLAVVANDHNSDGILVILTPQDMTNPTATADALVPYAKIGKPVLASWMGGQSVAEGARILSQAGIPNFPFPDQATDVFNYMYRYQRNLWNLYEETEASSTPVQYDRKLATAMIQEAYANKRQNMSEYESKQLLAAYGIPVCKTVVATSAEDAGKAAEEMGFPVVVKLHSEIVLHKSNVGGVVLNLKSTEAVKEAFNRIKANVEKLYGNEGQHFLGVTVQQMISLKGYEVIIGSNIDPLVGPIIVFGSGGTLVEIYRDTAMTLPPVTPNLARQLMQKTKIFTALQGYRDVGACDIPLLEQIIVGFSQMIVDHPQIMECDINPLIVSPDGIIAVDARIILQPDETKTDELPKALVASYPEELIQTVDDVLIRPIRPTDEPQVKAFSDSQAHRPEFSSFFKDYDLTGQIAHNKLSRMCFIDYDREVALVAETEGKIIGLARVTNIYGTSEAEMSLVIDAEYRGKKLGSALLALLRKFMKERNMCQMNARCSVDNQAALQFLKKHGFHVAVQKEDIYICKQDVCIL
ncbi:hypothetical protein P9112_004040 [Eukaryota sp. TZLM1-RC]